MHTQIRGWTERCVSSYTELEVPCFVPLLWDFPSSSCLQEILFSPWGLHLLQSCQREREKKGNSALCESLLQVLTPLHNQLPFVYFPESSDNCFRFSFPDMFIAINRRKIPVGVFTSIIASELSKLVSQFKTFMLPQSDLQCSQHCLVIIQYCILLNCSEYIYILRRQNYFKANGFFFDYGLMLCSAHSSYSWHII